MVLSYQKQMVLRRGRKNKQKNYAKNIFMEHGPKMVEEEDGETTFSPTNSTKNI